MVDQVKEICWLTIQANVTGLGNLLSVSAFNSWRMEYLYALNVKAHLWIHDDVVWEILFNWKVADGQIQWWKVVQTDNYELLNTE